MNATYIAARIQQIEWMLHRLTEAKAEYHRLSLRNPLSGRPLGERGAVHALRQNSECNDVLGRLMYERKTLVGGVA